MSASRINLTLCAIAGLLASTACSSDDTALVQPQFGKAVANPTPTFYLSNDAQQMLRGDGLPAYLEPGTSPWAGRSRYQHGDCGVDTKIFLDGSGDGVLNTAATVNRKCAAYPRKVRIDYMLINADGSLTPDGATTFSSFLNVRQLHKVTSPANTIPVGATQLRTIAFGDGEYKCGANGVGAILFAEVTQEGIVTGADRVNVKRLSADTWEVWTTEDVVDPVTGAVTHNDKAWCRANGKVYHMPLRLIIKSPTALSQ